MHIFKKQNKLTNKKKNRRDTYVKLKHTLSKTQENKKQTKRETIEDNFFI